MPDAKFRPGGYWESERTPLTWAAGSGQELYASSWATPLFDLRPDLRGAMSRESQAVPINRVAGTCLFISIVGLNSDLSGLSMFRKEQGHPVSSQAVHNYTPDTDVTSSLLTGQDGAILMIRPPGDAYPMRYWRLLLRFTITASVVGVPDPLPRLTIQAGMY